ncbi:MAG: ArsA family ATPase [Chloroflexi bacterium]|nr:ArsA family ATPase [Chloroflexota bacterium]
MKPDLSSLTADHRFLFFAGKGGVGKTTCAAATALLETQPVLAISLDPAHSMRDVLGAEKVRGLEVVEFDARAAFAGFLRRHQEHLGAIADRGTYLDEEDIRGLLDLSLPGLHEIMGLLELGALAAKPEPRRIIVDLPPTGHALRLFDVSRAFDQVLGALDLMQDKHRFAVTSLTRRYRPDQIDAFLESLQAQCVAARRTLLEDGSFVLVCRPEPAVLAETERLASRLRTLGASIAALIVNTAEPGEDVSLPASLAGMKRLDLPHHRRPPIGQAALKNLAQPDRAPPRPASNGGGLAPLLDDPRRLVIFAGKGGVGKTTMACATSLALARRNARVSVVLVSIDPAHSLADVLDEDLSKPPAGHQNLTAVELDPDHDWREWSEQAQGVFQGLAGATGWDPVYDRQIAEQIARIEPAGLDELRAATAVIDLLDEDPDRFVVVDSAPTGHLLRFLEAPGLVIAWSRELMHLLLKYDLATRLKDLSEELLSLSRKSKRLEALLRDPEQCEFAVVTLDQPVVLAETDRLVGRLVASGFPLRHVVVNRRFAGDGDDGLHGRWPGVDVICVSDRGRAPRGQAALEELAA